MSRRNPERIAVRQVLATLLGLKVHQLCPYCLGTSIEEVHPGDNGPLDFMPRPWDNQGWWIEHWLCVDCLEIWPVYQLWDPETGDFHTRLDPPLC